MQRPILVQEFDRMAEKLQSTAGVFRNEHGRYCVKPGEPNLARTMIELSWRIDDIRLSAFPHSSRRQSVMNPEALLIFDSLDIARNELSESLHRFRSALCEASPNRLHGLFPSGSGPAKSGLSGPVWTVLFSVTQLMAEKRGVLMQHGIQLGLCFESEQKRESSDAVLLGDTGT